MKKSPASLLSAARWCNATKLVPKSTSENDRNVMGKGEESQFIMFWTKMSGFPFDSNFFLKTLKAVTISTCCCYTLLQNKIQIFSNKVTESGVDTVTVSVIG